MVDYQGKNVVIIGLGITGLSCVHFFLERGVVPRVMDTRAVPPGVDKLPENVECHSGSLNNSWLQAADLIVASPGIALATPQYSRPQKMASKLWVISNYFAVKQMHRLSRLQVQMVKALSRHWLVKWLKQRVFQLV